MSISRLAIIEKSNLSEAQLNLLNDRLGAAEHANDEGVPKVWNIYQRGLYAFVEKSTGVPIGIAEVSGIPVSPGWWIDSQYRGKGYGTDLVVELARYLKSQDVSKAGSVRITTYQGRFDAPSRKLWERFKKELLPTTEEIITDTRSQSEGGNRVLKLSIGLLISALVFSVISAGYFKHLLSESSNGFNGLLDCDIKLLNDYNNANAISRGYGNDVRLIAFEEAIKRKLECNQSISTFSR